MDEMQARVRTNFDTQGLMKTLGARFDPRAFHAQVLDTGALPMPVLEKKIADWAKAGGNGASSNSGKGGLCIVVDFGDLVTVGSFQGAVAFRCGERSARGGRALGLQRGHGVGGFQLGFGQPQGLHQQGKAQAQRGGDGGVLPGIGAQGGQHVSKSRAGGHRRR